MPRRILVVDDNAINRQLLKTILSKHYDVVEAADGKEAMGLVKRNYKMYSAVLLDILMPVMDGFEFMRLFRDNPLYAQIPVIVVTAVNDDKTRMKALYLGANDFITKPYNPEMVTHCLKNNIALCETASTINAIQRDKLTGLYNREFFLEKAEFYVKRSSPGSYVMVCFDIDNFKIINDQYGALEGDKVLKHIGATLRRSYDEIGGVCGRISGDNFAGLLPNSAEVQERLKYDYFVDVVPKDLPYAINLSAGRYVVNDVTLSASAMYDRAYIAKRSVKGLYDKHIAYFDDTMLEELIREQKIISEMDMALNEKRFEVWFQPQYNHSTGALIGAEALVRWKNPEGGYFFPNDFIPVFEKNGFIYELDKYVWEDTCKHLRKWLDEGRNPVPVSVNVSRYDIFKDDFVSTLTNLRDKYGIPEDILRLEITESAFVISTERVIGVAEKLIKKGFIIEIDDFGSGYSSLNTLKDVPAQIIKLDMRFLRSINSSKRSGNIIESVVRMAKWLGLTVIAEGVETIEQADYLASIGCSNIQGYLYARPMPANDYENIEENQRKEPKLLELETLDKLDNESFWNPSSIETLIFNSYVGSACILEYCAGRIELIRANDKYAQLFYGTDFTLSDALKLDWENHMSPDALKRLKSDLRQSYETKRDVESEYHFINLPIENGELYIKVNIRVIASAGDRFLVYCLNENVTALRLSEQKALIANEQRETTAKQLEIVLQNTNSAVLATVRNNGGTRTVFANDRYFSMLGIDRELYEIKGLSLYSFMSEEKREEIRRIFDNLSENQSLESISCEITRWDGKERLLRLKAAKARFPGEENLAQLTILHDVTNWVESEKRRINAENEKIASDMQLKAIMDNIESGITATVLEGDKIKHLFINKRYYQQIGYTQEEYERRFKGKFFTVLDEDYDRLMNIMKLSNEDGLSRLIEYRIRRKDGAIRWIRNSINTIRMSGVDAPVNLCVSRDITLQMEKDEKLKRANEQIKAIMDDVKCGITAMVKDGDSLKFLMSNDRYYEMLGYTRKQYNDEITDPFMTVHSLDREKFREYSKKAYPMVDAKPTEFRFVRRDGEVRWALVQLSHTHFTGVDSEVQLWVFTDISENKLLERRLRNTRSQLKSVTENIPGGIATYACKGVALTAESVKLVYFNNGFSELFGYSRDEYQEIANKNPASLVFEEDKATLNSQFERLMIDGTPIDCVYRVHLKGGGYKWISHKGIPVDIYNGMIMVNAMLLDITPQLTTIERLRVSEEINRAAARISGNMISRFDIEKRSLSIDTELAVKHGIPDTITNVPYGQVEEGLVSPETAKDYVAFYNEIAEGGISGEGIFEYKMPSGYRWQSAKYSTIQSESGKPIVAVVSYTDITDRLERETVFTKWKQSLSLKNSKSYTLIRFNLTRDEPYVDAVGDLINMNFDVYVHRFNDYTREYAKMSVYEDDRQKYIELFDIEYLTKGFKEGNKYYELEYREIVKGGDKWIKVSVELVERPNSSDIEAYMMYEDIDAAKREELFVKQRAETDSLTGVLNRKTFTDLMMSELKKQEKDKLCALFMLDLDGFKQVNDSFGHAMGDQMLIELGSLLQSGKNEGDLVCRVGGDEFLMFLNNISARDEIAERARRVCLLARKSLSFDVRMSTSIGISVSPIDGDDFKTLYHKADLALYNVKASGKDGYAFYGEESVEGQEAVAGQEAETVSARKIAKEPERRMLIVEDNPINLLFLKEIFNDTYAVETAADGGEALIKMRRLGSDLSVVLLDLVLPEMDGFEVLEKMSERPETRAIPVIIVSGIDERETTLRAIRMGASDYITKPVDAELIKHRVKSVISKADNEKLKLKNKYLAAQNDEVVMLKAALAASRTAIAEMDITTGKFEFDDITIRKFMGEREVNSLWDIMRFSGVSEKDIEDTMNLSDKVIKDDSVNALCLTIRIPKENEQINCMIGVSKRKTASGIGKIIFTFTKIA